MSTRRRATAGLALASISAVVLLAEAGCATDDYYDQGPPPDYGQYEGDQGYAPPPGQYAPAPGGGGYSDEDRRYDRDYAARYSAWASRYCVDRRNNNIAAGAIIGGVLGALAGSGIAGHHERGEGAVVGGVLGAGAGAAIGASSSSAYGCPPGYVASRGAPAFYYGYEPPAPGWYNPWVWSGGVWVYHPYRAWYYDHPRYRGG